MLFCRTRLSLFKTGSIGLNIGLNIGLRPKFQFQNDWQAFTEVGFKLGHGEGSQVMKRPLYLCAISSLDIVQVEVGGLQLCDTSAKGIVHRSVTEGEGG